MNIYMFLKLVQSMKIDFITSVHYHFFYDCFNVSIYWFIQWMSFAINRNLFLLQIKVSR